VTSVAASRRQRDDGVRRTGPTRGYLDQVDVVRLLTFGSVILVHTIASLTPQDDATARGTLMMLHFTRETFFVITGFVLFHSSYRADLDLRRFWRRRFLLIGLPYLTWSLIYFGWHGWHESNGALHGGAGHAMHELWFQLLTGTAEYHLYFLLVSMQVYLVFGLLVRLVRATTGHHGLLLAGVAVYQLGLFWLLHDVLPSWSSAPRPLGIVAAYAQQLLPSYLVYVVAGALAAVHVERTQAWVLGHGRLVVGALAVGAVLTEGAYLWQVGTGTPPFRAADVLQPVMVGWTLVVTAGLLALGLSYAVHVAQAERRGWRARAVSEGARISFGVFLVHPLAISLLLLSPYGDLIARPGQPWQTALLWLGTVVVGVAVAEVAARTPLSLPLTGRRYSQPAPRLHPGTAGTTPTTEQAPTGAAGPTTTGRSSS
jgi:peptidoglycan/LPS O-acetylase OafA/YrhL